MLFLAIPVLGLSLWSAVLLLWRVEIPLALPVVMAGIKTATVEVMASATLATLVGAGGLGRFLPNHPRTRQQNAP